MRTKLTDHFDSLFLDGGTKALRGKGITVAVRDTRKGSAVVEIAVVDKKGKKLAYVESGVLRDGDTVTVFRLDQMFHVSLVKDRRA